MSQNSTTERTNPFTPEEHERVVQAVREGRASADYLVLLNRDLPEPIFRSAREVVDLLLSRLPESGRHA